MTSGGGRLSQGPRRPLESSDGRRRLGPANLLQALYQGPGIGALPLARLDEGLQLDLEELGDFGVDGHRFEGRAFHGGYFGSGDVSGKCQGDVRRAVSFACRGSG